MRTIDADELKETISNAAATSSDGSVSLSEIVDFIDNTKTIDTVILPCKLGDPVYIIANLKNGNPSHIMERKCIGIHITEKVFRHRAEKAHRYLVTKSDIGFAEHIPFTEFGKTVFFTREEAEATLAIMYK